LRSIATDSDALRALGERVAMHVVAASPLFLSRESVPTEVLMKEAEILREQAKDSGKPADVVEKMVQGRIGKFYQEVCLLDQTFLIDEKVCNPQVTCTFKVMPELLPWCTPNVWCMHGIILGDLAAVVAASCSLVTLRVCYVSCFPSCMVL